MLVGDENSIDESLSDIISFSSKPRILEAQKNSSLQEVISFADYHLCTDNDYDVVTIFGFYSELFYLNERNREIIYHELLQIAQVIHFYQEKWMHLYPHISVIWAIPLVDEFTQKMRNVFVGKKLEFIIYYLKKIIKKKNIDSYILEYRTDQFSLKPDPALFLDDLTRAYSKRKCSMPHNKFVMDLRPTKQV